MKKSSAPPAPLAPRIARFEKDLQIISMAFAREFPFWGVLAERCRFSVTDRSDFVSTAGVTKDGHITFNLDFFEGLTKRQFLFIVAHEICHFVFEHHGRQGARDHHMFNKASDYAVNLMLKYQFETGDFIPSDVLLDDKYDGWSAERIYDDLEQSPDAGSVVFMVDLVGSQGEGEGEGGSVMVRDRRVDLPKGSAGQSEQDRGQEFRDWIRQAICEAHATAKSQGKMPAGLERVIVGHLKPKVNWLQALRQRLRLGASRKASRDITWTVPNRRFLGESYIFPSSVGPDQPKIAFAIDTSGSMSEDDLKQAIAELEDIRSQFNARVYFLDCDAGVYESRWVSPYEPLPALQGGGGTDFAPVFSHLIENRIQPDYCVMFTDGYGSFGEDPTGKFDVLWAITNEQVNPPFGDVIRVNMDNESN